ncbi:universal stress protein [Changchengzhania lutea]|uniref:universal stress protein n=1 Tax=Changchengzhania lutea TaxID=2049305 RepID=UPI00115EC582|nr:universal stress protein [Changchengzhania lutea]
MTRILLPTDFSNNSFNAIDYALELFRDSPCEFYIHNVQKASSFITDDMLIVSASTTIYNTIIKAAKQSIANIISRAEGKYKNKKHTFFASVDYDNFIDSINQITEKTPIDLIIMGTKGAAGIEKVVFGSNTVRVIQRCKAPVLVIPKDSKFKEVKNIAVINSFSTSYDLKTLKPLSEIHRILSSNIKVVHVNYEQNRTPHQTQNIDSIKELCHATSEDFLNSTNTNLFETVQEFIINNDVDMLAMVGEKHTFLERLFKRHAVETFAYKIDIPLLILKSDTDN